VRNIAWLVLIVLVGCTGADPILGRWEEVSGPGLDSRPPDVVEFLADGTVDPDGYHWRRDENGQIIVEAPMVGRDPITVGVISLGEDDFTITTPNSQSVFRRVSEAD
jgi:hypothetical protein